MFCHIYGLVFDDVSGIHFSSLGAIRDGLFPDIVGPVDPGATSRLASWGGCPGAVCNLLDTLCYRCVVQDFYCPPLEMNDVWMLLWAINHRGFIA